MLDLTKPIRTTDGNRFVLYATDGPGDFPIHGSHAGIPQAWALNGQPRRNSTPWLENYTNPDVYIQFGNAADLLADPSIGRPRGGEVGCVDSGCARFGLEALTRYTYTLRVSFHDDGKIKSVDF
jgi:hypothetical protein